MPPLTLLARREKSSGQVSPLHSNQYAEWRRRSGLVWSLREERETPPERLLQAIWFHQRLKRDQLRTVDGKAVRVLHPGFWNREAGPDFRGAMIQFDNDPPQSGDVEIDLHRDDWRGHQHDRNPNFKNVMLHVVWEETQANDLRTLALKPVLDSPLSDLALWLGSEAAGAYPIELLGQCCAPLRGLSVESLGDLLHQAAFIRMQAKATHLQARARQAGWEQALWEGLFRALGYKQNLWPMQRLAELRSRLCPEGIKLAVPTLQARLLGAGGLLPDELTRARTPADRYVRRLWDSWWRERDDFEHCALPRALWKFSGLRPANHPQRRLALAAHWLAHLKLSGRVEAWCVRSLEPAQQGPALLEIFQAPDDEFWSRHWTLRSRPMSKPQPLLGATRVTDLAMNVVLPWLWIRAVEGRNEGLREEIERRYFSWPAAQDNSVLRLARQRLLGASSARFFRSAARQQGLLQIVKDFCEHSNAICADCRFPELVRQWPDSLNPILLQTP
jgi:hypothetical protein